MLFPSIVRETIADRAHFADHCAVCHGNDGKGQTAFGKGLYPRPPDLSAPATQDLSDGELFYVIENGVRFTGMPAFGGEGPPALTWHLVTFIRHLPSLTPEEKAALARGRGDEEHDQGEHEHEEAASPGARVHEVSITGFKYVPATLEVREGDVVEWKNADMVPHTATADDKTFDTGKLEAGQAKRVVVRKKGEFPYSCDYHMGMRGKLVVL